jgi:hypothetical protein
MRGEGERQGKRAERNVIVSVRSGERNAKETEVIVTVNRGGDTCGPCRDMKEGHSLDFRQYARRAR